MSVAWRARRFSGLTIPVRILVYDAAVNEIGDGSGAQVGLTRAIVLGDVLTVIQQLGQCSSSSAYQTGVVCASTKTCG